MPTKHLLVKGKVQGVFYRASAKDIADKMGLSGWTRNTKDGAVEMMVTGSEAHISEFIIWCRKGPARAVVTDILITEKQEETFKGFLIVR